MVFPKPVDSTMSIPPNWAIAVIVAAAGVTILWIIVIVILVSIDGSWAALIASF